MNIVDACQPFKHFKDKALAYKSQGYQSPNGCAGSRSGNRPAACGLNWPKDLARLSKTVNALIAHLRRKPLFFLALGLGALCINSIVGGHDQYPLAGFTAANPQ